MPFHYSIAHFVLPSFLPSFSSLSIFLFSFVFSFSFASSRSHRIRKCKASHGFHNLGYTYFPSFSNITYACLSSSSSSSFFVSFPSSRFVSLKISHDDSRFRREHCTLHELTNFLRKPQLKPRFTNVKQFVFLINIYIYMCMCVCIYTYMCI